jgi:hypothetical protein
MFLINSQILYCQDYIKTRISGNSFYTSYYDSTDNSLYAGGNGLIKIKGSSWSYFKSPDVTISALTKFRNDLYIGTYKAVYKFDGTNWINTDAPKSDWELFYNSLLIYNNELYAFNGVLQDSLWVWNGTQWHQIDPGVSSSGIGCRGISYMYYFNDKLYATSATYTGGEWWGGEAVIIKLVNGKWSIPNGEKINSGGYPSCVFQNKLYIADGDRFDIDNGESWEDLVLFFHYGTFGSSDIKSMVSNDLGLFISGRIDEVISSNGNISTKNLVMICGNGSVSPLDAGMDIVWNLNFLDNQLYAFGDDCFSILSNLDKLPNPQISIGDTILCQNESLDIKEQSNSGNIWLWQISDERSFKSKEVELYNLEPGIYSPKVSVSNCAGVSTITFNNLITVHESPSVPLIEIKGDTMLSSSQSNNKWYLLINGENKFIDSTNFIIFEKTPNTYISVSVMNEFGCSSKSSLMPTNIDNSKISEYISIFPNPSNGIISIVLNDILIKNNSCLNIEIFNLRGQKISHFEISKLLKNKKLDLSNLQEGIYFLKIYNGLESSLHKIIIE